MDSTMWMVAPASTLASAMVLVSTLHGAWRSGDVQAAGTGCMHSTLLSRHSQLLASVDDADLGNADALLFFQCLLDVQNLLRGNGTGSRLVSSGGRGALTVSVGSM